MSTFKLPSKLRNANKKSIAKQLSDALPSFKELVNSEEMTKVVHPMQMFGWKNQPNEWELVVIAVDNMMRHMQGQGFYSSYACENDASEGWAYLLDHSGTEHRVNAEEFFAIAKLMFVTWLQLPMSDKAYDLYLDFKASDNKIWKILD